MNPIWRSASFWTMLVAAIAQVLVGLHYNLEAEMLITLAATVLGYLAQRGWVERAAIEAEGAYDEGYNAGQKAAERAAKEAANLMRATSK